MNEKYSIQSTHTALKEKMIDYVSTVYLGKNDDLRLACENELKAVKTLYQAPYIEANQAYKVDKNGIDSIVLPDDRQVIKKSLQQLSSLKLGVFPNPYLHQTKALKAFAEGKDVFVATGTGSGKTECFMWPMVSKLLEEATNQPKTWEKRGVRAMMLYPMNALVSDQLGRLRKLIGDRDGKFQSVLSSISPYTRTPQFGMYTGRTAYPGPQNEKKDKDLANTIYKDLINQIDESSSPYEYMAKEKNISDLIKLGKYPAKKNLEEFASRLNLGEHFTNPLDAELITRQEIRQHCPDILITNYSMLQYMLIRPLEDCIWNDTKEWLASDPSNKLLFIIDEAHMYRGSAGGEVALLIRRFMHKLEIDRSRIQFILTSASIPKDQMDEVYAFANDLTAGEASNNKFKILTGKQEDIIFDNTFEIDPYKLQSINSTALYSDASSKLNTIKQICTELKWSIDDTIINDENALSVFLYNKLSKCYQMLKVIEKCRGNATKYDDLCFTAFEGVDKEIAYKATDILLSLAHLAKTPDGAVFFPTRLHLMFRGLKGISACSNPSCVYGDEHSKSLGLGKIYLGTNKDRCKCGSKIYELINDRACGAIFFKGYLDETKKDFIWSKVGEKFNSNFKEVHFYILSSNSDYKIRTNDKAIWVDSLTGKIQSNDNQAGKDGFIRLIYSKKEVKGKPGMLTFATCPKCEKRKLTLTDFITKGNEPFFNLVSEQFYTQPQTIFDENEIEKTPNAGRKVLLFSDSRQRAAVLAKDLTRSADEDAMKKAITLSVIELQKWADANNELPSLDLLYIAFLKVASENNLRFFYGEDEKILKDSISGIKDRLSRSAKRGRKADFKSMKDLYPNIPSLYKEQIIKQLCHNFHSLVDAALCYIVPLNKDYMLDDILEDLDVKRINISEDDFIRLFTAWATEIMTSSYAIGNDIKDNVRGDLTSVYRFGVKDDDNLSTNIKNILKEQNYSENDIVFIYDCLKKYLAKNIEDGNDKLYLNLSLISLKYDENQKWYKCPRCSSVFPFTLWDKCAKCGKGSPVEMTELDYNRISFWRAPVIKAITEDGKKLSMTRINVEEHTAQLSHKDGKLKTWSTTEDFEMRFQNVYANNDKPVDVLSCTTTMEVGIDIGSLTAVGLRNIPPMRENYQQRAGRAGRRSASISTIVTYTDNGPYDSHYFFHPEKIISGDARKPWIDTSNKKLVFRHLNSIILCEIIKGLGTSVDKLGAVEFISAYFDAAITNLSNFKLSNNDIKRLLPCDISFSDFSLSDLVNNLNKLKVKIEEFTENYKDDERKEKSLLEVFLEEGIFPTYSFPRNVVGFHIEDNRGSEIIEKPDRSIDIALNEYAPGRIVVVNKKSYKSGGIYNFHSKFIYGQYDKAAEKYIKSKEYYKTVHYCENPQCTWQDINLPKNGICPFCSEQISGHNSMIKPWGFAPLNAQSVPEADAEAENSYATEPVYSLPIKQEELKLVKGFSNLNIAKLPDQPLTILNTGAYEDGERKGFMMCKLCGAIVPGDDYNTLKSQSPNPPYRHPIKGTKPCRHPESDCEKVFLGHQLLTDMVVFEISLDNKKIDTSSDNVWLKSAATTLSEAMALSAGRLLDVEFTDIKSGFRIRHTPDCTYVDIYLFDNLSSGAGYSAAIADMPAELFDETRKTLSECKNNCDSACQECLKHFWNQQKQIYLNRGIGLWLLDWISYNKLPDPINYSAQKELFAPMQSLLKPFYNVSCNNNMIKINNSNVYVYPAMWNKYSSEIPNETISISDKLLKDSLPEAFNMITDKL